MPFAYYDRLSSRDKAIYRRSDEIGEVLLPFPDLLRPFVKGVHERLNAEDPRGLQGACDALCRGMATMLGIPPASIEVLAVRPSANWGELHGLYTPAEGLNGPLIQVWMRTVRQRRVVAFRTFLRTLLHEFGHHLDYQHLKLADSFHTEGFFRRESSLFRQLAPEEAVLSDRTRGRG
jgi:hypothetical protein